MRSIALIAIAFCASACGDLDSGSINVGSPIGMPRNSDEDPKPLIQQVGEQIDEAV